MSSVGLAKLPVCRNWGAPISGEAWVVQALPESIWRWGCRDTSLALHVLLVLYFLGCTEAEPLLLG